MIHHVAIWSVRPDVDEPAKEALLRDMREMLTSLPMVRSFALGSNVTPARARGLHMPLRDRQRRLASDVIALDIEG